VDETVFNRVYLRRIPDEVQTVFDRWRAKRTLMHPTAASARSIDAMTIASIPVSASSVSRTAGTVGVNVTVPEGNSDCGFGFDTNVATLIAAVAVSSVLLGA
jgi:hypothetical protein